MKKLLLYLGSTFALSVFAFQLSSFTPISAEEEEVTVQHICCPNGLVCANAGFAFPNTIKVDGSTCTGHEDLRDK
ncbi:MAG: hypothetical protein LAT68_13375 [Cyclobacteriaceae bacterium]|nr:hypothetical protein [Cyclobacteriaceae bacterium]MCH8517311.1 hypothetical protein [Cyclobacteriaceae bacterium]